MCGSSTQSSPWTQFAAAVSESRRFVRVDLTSQSSSSLDWSWFQISFTLEGLSLVASQCRTGFLIKRLGWGSVGTATADNKRKESSCCRVSLCWWHPEGHDSIFWVHLLSIFTKHNCFYKKWFQVAFKAPKWSRKWLKYTVLKRIVAVPFVQKPLKKRYWKYCSVLC